MNPTEGLIDVRALMARLSDAQLLAAADAYFSQLGERSEQCRKPFSNPDDAIHITRQLSLLLQAADLFPAADVLDFGCATGWLTLALADLGTHAIGVDIAPSAIALAESLHARRAVPVTGSARFCAYDGQRLPLPDQSVDRVLCFDAFHHVRDQAHALQEFARVLRPGGRVAMVEPGPNHSRTAQSQMEMARYEVIENDVVMAEVAALGERVGLLAPQMLVQMQRPLTIPLDLFAQWSSSSELPQAESHFVLSTFHNELTDSQCFFMSKGAPVLDSRDAGALAAQLLLISANPVDAVPGMHALKFRFRNTGEAIWITEPGRAGRVNLGCQLIGVGGGTSNLDHARFPLPLKSVAPGDEVELVVELPYATAPAIGYRFDLVAEQVAWFAQNGRCQSVVWPSTHT